MSGSLLVGSGAGGVVVGLIVDELGARVRRPVRRPTAPGESVADDALDAEPLAAEMPASDVPASDVPASDVPASDVPASDVPASDVPASDVPASDVPASDVPASDVPASDVPASDPDVTRRGDPAGDRDNEGNGDVSSNEQESGNVANEDGEDGETWVPPSIMERVGVACLTGALFVGAAIRIGQEPILPTFCIFFAGLVAVSISDVRVGLVPRKFVYATLFLVFFQMLLVATVDDRWTSFLHAVIAGLVAFGVFFALWFVAPRHMGFGDVRLAGLIGLGLGWLGYWETYVGFVAAFFAGSIFGIGKMLVLHTGRKTALPFGPSLATGAVVGVLWGGAISNLWLHH